MLNRALTFRYLARVQKLIKFISSCWTSHISFILFNSTISDETHLSIPSINVCVCVCLCAHVCVCLLSLLCLQNFNAALSPGSLHMYVVEFWTCFFIYLHSTKTFSSLQLSGDFNMNTWKIPSVSCTLWVFLHFKVEDSNFQLHFLSDIVGTL